MGRTDHRTCRVGSLGLRDEITDPRTNSYETSHQTTNEDSAACITMSFVRMLDCAIVPYRVSKIEGREGGWTDFLEDHV